MQQPRRRILILDDSDICREMAQMELEEHGYDVTGLDGPGGFADALRQSEPDLALVDVSMPGLDGRQLVEIARGAEPHRCVIVLFSDRSEGELQGLVRSWGAAGFIRKSGKEGELVRQVEQFLGGPW
ncbi:MAG: response regulator [Deltaproteobacteria bacterium]|nr:response regulator [Deltaproteobacteria bacterium]